MSRVVIHEEVREKPEIPGLVDAMRVVLAAREKLAIASGRVTEAKGALAAAEKQRDMLTEAVVRGDVVGPGELREAESAIRDAESFVLLLGKGVEAAQANVAQVESAMGRVRSAENTRRVDAAAQRRLDAIAAWKQAHVVIEDVTRAEHEVRYQPIPVDEIERHWRMARDA